MDVRALEMEIQGMGYVGKFASLDHLASLMVDIESLVEAGKIPVKISRDYLQYDYSIPEDFSSVLITACKIPNSRIEVECDAGIMDMILPTVYRPTKEAADFDVHMEHYFKAHDIQFKKVHLPLKLLAARTGLGHYGRNNISYVGDFGSYHKLTAFYTSVAVASTPWQDIQFHSKCESCHICEANCPSGIISHDHYLIDTSRCLPLPNEIEGDFPEWVKADAHNALMGCLRCQSICPINPPLLQTTEFVARFSKAVVTEILEKTEVEALTEEALSCIKAIGFDDFYPVFRRNFIALYSNVCLVKA